MSTSRSAGSSRGVYEPHYASRATIAALAELNNHALTPIEEFR